MPPPPLPSLANLVQLAVAHDLGLPVSNLRGLGVEHVDQRVDVALQPVGGFADLDQRRPIHRIGPIGDGPHDIAGGVQFGYVAHANPSPDARSDWTRPMAASHSSGSCSAPSNIAISARP